MLSTSSLVELEVEFPVCPKHVEFDACVSSGWRRYKLSERSAIRTLSPGTTPNVYVTYMCWYASDYHDSTQTRMQSALDSGLPDGAGTNTRGSFSFDTPVTMNLTSVG